MMYNHIKQVCDWPNKVVQLRPECRDEAKLDYIMTSPWQRARTQRMLRFLGPRTHTVQHIKTGHGNQEDNFGVQSITEIITNKIKEQINQHVPNEEEFYNVVNNFEEDDNGYGKNVATLPEETREYKELFSFPATPSLNKAATAKIRDEQKQERMLPKLKKSRKFILNNRNQLIKRRMHLASKRKQEKKHMSANKMPIENVGRTENPDLTIGIKMGYGDDDFITFNESYSEQEKLNPASNKLLLLKSVIQQAKDEVEDSQVKEEESLRQPYVNSNLLRYD